MHKIEKNIEIPRRCANSKGRPFKYPFNEMEVGDSFLTGEPRSRISGAIGGYRKRHGCKFAARTVEGGVRVWRIE